MTRIWLYSQHAGFTAGSGNQGVKVGVGPFTTPTLREFVLFSTVKGLCETERGVSPLPSTPQSHLSGQSPLKLKAMATTSSGLLPLISRQQAQNIAT